MRACNAYHTAATHASKTCRYKMLVPVTTVAALIRWPPVAIGVTSESDVTTCRGEATNHSEVSLRASGPFRRCSMSQTWQGATWLNSAFTSATQELWRLQFNRCRLPRSSPHLPHGKSLVSRLKCGTTETDSYASCTASRSYVSHAGYAGLPLLRLLPFPCKTARQSFDICAPQHWRKIIQKRILA